MISNLIFKGYTRKKKEGEKNLLMRLKPNLKNSDRKAKVLRKLRFMKIGLKKIFLKGFLK